MEDLVLLRALRDVRDTGGGEGLDRREQDEVVALDDRVAGDLAVRLGLQPAVHRDHLVGIVEDRSVLGLGPDLVGDVVLTGHREVIALAGAGSAAEAEGGGLLEALEAAADGPAHVEAAVLHRAALHDSAVRAEGGRGVDLLLAAALAHGEGLVLPAGVGDVARAGPLPDVACEIEDSLRTGAAGEGAHRVHVADAGDLDRRGLLAGLEVVAPGIDAVGVAADRALELVLIGEAQARPLGVAAGVLVVGVDDRLVGELLRHLPLGVLPVPLPPLGLDEGHALGSRAAFFLGLLAALTFRDEEGLARRVDRILAPGDRRLRARGLDVLAVLLVRDLGDHHVEVIDADGVLGDFGHEPAGVLLQLRVVLEQLDHVLERGADLGPASGDQDQAGRRLLRGCRSGRARSRGQEQRGGQDGE